MKKIIDVLQEVMEGGFEQAGYDKKFGFVTVSNRPDLCQYQCNGAMAAAKQYKMAPFQIAEKVVEAVKENDVFEKIEMVKPGFINITVSGKLLVDFGKAMMTEEKFGIPVTAADSVREAVCDADIVCTVTPSREPYLESDWIAPGTHINAVGAFTPTTREVTSTLVAKARLYADQVEAMRKECGEYLVPLQEGLIGPDHIVGSLGDVLLGRVPGRSSGEEITLFDALGLAVEDVACVKYLCGGSRS